MLGKYSVTLYLGQSESMYCRRIRQKKNFNKKDFWHMIGPIDQCQEGSWQDY